MENGAGCAVVGLRAGVGDKGDSILEVLSVDGLIEGLQALILFLG